MKRNAKSLQAKAKLHDVKPVSGKGQWVVISGTSQKQYTVFALEYGGYACTCKFGKRQHLGSRPCSHVLAVQDYLESCKGRTLSYWPDDESADKQHRPVKRVGLDLWSTSRAGA
jgi:hypothetical protein